MSEGNSGERQARFKVTGAAKAAKTGARPAGHPVVHWLGAMASVGVLAVMVYWGLQLVQRDPSEVPVIRAMAGPARVLPDEPGGVTSNYTGLAVNSVQSEGEAEEPSDRVVLAPAPRGLLAEDVPVTTLAQPGDTSDRPVAELILDSVESAISDGRPDPQDQDLVTDAAAIEDRPQEDGPITLTVHDVPDGMRLDTSDGEAKLVAGEEPAAASGTKHAPKTSVIPQFRVGKLRLASAGATAPAAQVRPLAREVPDAPLGTRLIQLGAYDSRETALKEWVRISERYRDLLGSKNFLVQSVTTGGRQFYRLRAVGFADSTESKSMCSALVQRGAQCIPVVAR